MERYQICYRSVVSISPEGAQKVLGIFSNSNKPILGFLAGRVKKQFDRHMIEFIFMIEEMRMVKQEGIFVEKVVEDFLRVHLDCTSDLSALGFESTFDKYYTKGLDVGAKVFDSETPYAAPKLRETLWYNTLQGPHASYTKLGKNVKRACRTNAEETKKKTASWKKTKAKKTGNN